MGTRTDREEIGKQRAAKRSWEPMRVTYVGHVSQIVLRGMGKLTAVGGDPGDPRKPKGQR